MIPIGRDAKTGRDNLAVPIDIELVGARTGFREGFRAGAFSRPPLIRSSSLKVAFPGGL